MLYFSSGTASMLNVES